MTKFILHGGNTGVENKDNEVFFSEFTKDFSNTKLVNILLVYFSRNESEWTDLGKQDIKNITRHTKSKSITFDVAKEDIFKEQMRKADVIYFRGGDTYKLLEKLIKIKNLKSFFENKIVIGSSAGACVLGKYFYDNDYDKIDQGLGIIDFKVFCHYDESCLNLARKLDDYKEKLELILLPAYKHKIIYKSDSI